MLMPDMRFSLPVLLTLALLVACTGCNDEDSNPVTTGTPDNIPNTSLTFPGTPEQLMDNFHTIYETRDADEYKLMLDPAFETILQDATIWEFPQVGPRLDASEEGRIHDRLFSGENLTDHGGDFIPAILNFSFSRLRPVVDWGVSLQTDPIPNTLSALYEVELLADRGQNFSTYYISGRIRFYVTEAEGRLNGRPKTYYRMVGQLDLTQSQKDVQHMNWGSLKAWFY